MVATYKTKITSDAADPSANVHQVLKVVLIMAQCFGQMPVQGITSPTPKSLRFTWISFRFAYSILLIVGAVFVLCTEFFALARGEKGVHDLG